MAGPPKPPQRLILDPELPPNRLLVVPDLNTMMDVAAASRLPSGSNPRSVTAPGEYGMTVAVPTSDSRVPFHALAPLQQSLAFYQSLTTGRFGAQPDRPDSGVPVSVFTSDDALALLATKLTQSSKDENPNMRGFGWSREEAEEFVRDFVVPFVEKTGGEVFKQVPIIDPERYGQEDGAIMGIADAARRRHSDEITDTVVVTRDKGMTRLADKRTFRDPGQVAVVGPHDYAMDSVELATFQRSATPKVGRTAARRTQDAPPAQPVAAATRPPSATGPSPGNMPKRAPSGGGRPPRPGGRGPT